MQNSEDRNADTAIVRTPQFIDPTGAGDPPITDGLFAYYLAQARSRPDQVAVIRRMVLRKFGEMSALIQAGIDDDFKRRELCAFVSISLGGALDALLPGDQSGET